MMIEKKCWPIQFQAILDGKKNFDIRLDEFQCETGDIILLKEFNPQTKTYTGREIKKEVKYIMKTNETKFWSDEEKEKGFMVLGF